jgi:uncharacterized protein YaeQ
MAQKATIYKAELQIADMDRGYYGDHSLTLPCQPSETQERLMVRLLAFALHAQEGLALANGMITNDEPEIWWRDLTGAIHLWIDLGQPEERLLRKACNRSEQVVLYTWGRAAEIWWAGNRGQLERQANLRVRLVPLEAAQALAAMAKRSMRLQFTVQDGQVWVGDGDENVALELVDLKAVQAA